MDDKITGFKKNKLVLHEVEPLKLCDTKKKNHYSYKNSSLSYLQPKNVNSKTRSSKNSEDLVILCYV